VNSLYAYPKKQCDTCTENTVLGAVKHIIFVNSSSLGDTHGQTESLKAEFSSALERISKEMVAAINGIFSHCK
jgi:hypothetical protein